MITYHASAAAAKAAKAAGTSNQVNPPTKRKRKNADTGGEAATSKFKEHRLALPGISSDFGMYRIIEALENVPGRCSG